MKKIIKEIFHLFGYSLTRLNPENTKGYQTVKALMHKKINVVLDIGANTGQFACEIRKYGYKGKIISFEPLPDAHKKLVENSKKDTKWIIHERCAVGERNGDIEINVAGNSESSSILPMLSAHILAAPHTSYLRKEKTPLITLDSVLAKYVNPTDKLFIKIDTQGYESMVLDGANKTIDFCNGVLIEMSLVPLYEGQSLWKNIIQRLESKGCSLFSIQNAFVNYKTGQTLQIDGIFFKNEEI